MAVTSYGVELRVPVCVADGITIAVILCKREGSHFGLFLTKDIQGRDQKRPRYFTSCPYTKPSTGSGTYIARLANLGGDLYNLKFNGKPVEASWSTIYVVPTISDLDFQSSTTPNLIINCNPASHFRVPRWLVTRFIALQFTVTQIKKTDPLQVLKLFHTRESDIFVSLGSCSVRLKDNRDLNNAVELWAKVDIVPYGNRRAFPHDCSKDHLNSKSWEKGSKVFGDNDRGVQLSLIPSKWKPHNELLVIDLKLFGRVFEEMLQDSGVPSLSSLLVEIEKDKAPIVQVLNQPAPRHQPRKHSQIEPAYPPTSSIPSSPTPSHYSTSTVASHTRSRIPRLMSRRIHYLSRKAEDHED